MDATLLEKIKQNLLEERERLEKELSGFAIKDKTIEDNYTATFQDFGTDEGETATEVADFGDRLSLEKTLEQELHAVHAALNAIEAGTYGVCQKCGQPIEAERLLVQPIATTCIACSK